MNFNRLTQGEKLVVVAGVLLLIDLLFLPWHSIDLPGLAGGDITRTAVQSPNGAYGVLALLVTIVMVGQIVAARLTNAKVPELSVPWAQIHMIAGFVVLGLLLLKLLVETDALGFGCWLGIVLAGVIAFGGYTIKKEAIGGTRTTGL